MWWHSNDGSLQKTNRHRTSTPFPKPRRQQIQERPSQHDGSPLCTVYLPLNKDLQKNATSYAPCFESCAIRKHWSILPQISSARNQIIKLRTVPSADPSVYIVLPFKDQRPIADRVRKDIYSLGAKIDVDVKPVFTSRKLSQNSGCQGKQTPDRQHSLRCTLISMWFVWCKLCRVHSPTLASKHKWTPLFSHRETPWITAWQQQNKVWPPFQSSEEMYQQVWLLSLRDVVHKGHQDANRLHSHQTGHILVTLSYILFSLLCFLPWELYP